MTTVYFVRHAEPDLSVRDELTRPLSRQGMLDRRLVTEYLADKRVDAVLSSPFRRALDTVGHFAQQAGLPVSLVEDFRERKVGDAWVEDFAGFASRQWADFDFRLPGGESLREVSRRNAQALHGLLTRFDGQSLVVGTHGTALSTLIHHYDPSYGYDQFLQMMHRMPWLVRMDFCGTDIMGLQTVDLLHPPVRRTGGAEVEISVLGALKAYRFVVVFARHRGKWLYCRARSRNCYETAGGHVEPGETALEAARRELVEETGALSYDIRPLFDYRVRRDGEWSNGQVFLAGVEALGDMPPFEMAEVRLYDSVPETMRFPEILPVLFDAVNAQWKGEPV